MLFNEACGKGNSKAQADNTMKIEQTCSHNGIQGTSTTEHHDGHATRYNWPVFN